MPEYKFVRRCGCVSLVKREDTGTYYLRYSINGKRQLEGIGVQEKVKDAVDAAAARGRELSRVEDLTHNVGRLAVGEAITQALASYSKAKDALWLAELKTSGQRFCDWLIDATGRPVVFWDEMSSSLVRAYLDHLSATGKRAQCAGKKGTRRKVEVKPFASQTLRHYIKPVLLASRYMSELDPQAFQPITVRHPSLAKQRPSKAYLDYAELKALLDAAKGKPGKEPGRYSREEPPMAQAEIAVLLAGFCGLRVRECARLRVADVDAKAATVTVTESKTVFSARCVPVPNWVAARIVDLAGKREWLFPSDDGTTHQTGEGDVSKRVKALLARAKLDTVTARDLRKSFINAAVAAGVGFGELQAYVGHSPTSMLTEHYADYGRLDVLRARVVDRMEAHFSQPAAKVESVAG